MKRRIFLTSSMVASALLANAEISKDEKPKKGFKVEKGKGRNVEGGKVLGGIFDTVRTTKGGPPLHFHHEQDEWFYVIRGEFKIQVGDDTFLLKEGDSAFGPRKVPHSFAKVSQDEGQLMVLFQPAGTMEAFFKEREALEMETDKEKKEAKLKTLWDRHGMKAVGPPLKI